MSTLTSLRTDVRSLIGESVAAFWTNDEIDSYLVDGIRNAQADCLALFNPDSRVEMRALQAVFQKLVHVSTGTTASVKLTLAFGVDTTPNLLHLLHFKTDVRWDIVDYNYWQDVESDEGSLDYANTESRLVTLLGANVGDDSRLVFYPSLATATAWEIRFIKRANESDAMNLPEFPVNMQLMAVLDAAEKAALKKSRDLPLSEKLRGERDEMLATVARRYGNSK